MIFSHVLYQLSYPARIRSIPSSGATADTGVAILAEGIEHFKREQGRDPVPELVNQPVRLYYSYPYMNTRSYIRYPRLDRHFWERDA